MTAVARANGADLAALAAWSRTGLDLPEGMTFEAWCDVGAQLRSVEQSVMWWIGDWLNFGERRYGETYAQAIEATGFSQQTLMDAKWVAARYEISRRRENLPFSAHREAASLPTLEREDVLQAAEDNGWSTRDLRREVKRRKAEISGDEADALPNVEPDSPFGYALHCLKHLIAGALGLEPETFVGETKGSPQSVHARQVLFYLLHTDGEFDQARIAGSLGRHRSTVSHAIDVVLSMREEDGIDECLAELGQMYRRLRSYREAVPALIEAAAP